MAENQNDNVELIDEDEVFTLYDENNNPVDFNVVATVEYQGEFYALMQPVEPMDDLGEDEALIFKVVQKNDEEDEFIPVTDETVLDAVFNEYLKAEAEFADGCDCDCDCDCDDCAGEDDHCDCDCGCHGDRE